MADTDREDLGALFAWTTRRLLDLESPILAAHELTMWEYVVLSFLARHPAPNQRALADGIGHDKTRLIPLLDELQERSLIDRRPDPADRRSHVVSITDAGHARHTTVRQAIRAMEDEFLSGLDADERRVLLRALPRLAVTQEDR